MRIVTAFIAVALLSSAPLGSSFAQRGLAPPRVSVKSLEPLPSFGTEQRFRVVVLFENLNTEPLKIRGIEFTLRLVNQGMLDGATPPMTIEALDQQTFTIEMGSETVSSLSYLMSFVQGPENTLPYEIYGKVTYERKMIDPVDFGGRGQVPLVLANR